MTRYICRYAGKKHILEAADPYEARRLAVAHFKVPRSKLFTLSLIPLLPAGTVQIQQPYE